MYAIMLSFNQHVSPSIWTFQLIRKAVKLSDLEKQVKIDFLYYLRKLFELIFFRFISQVWYITVYKSRQFIVQIQFNRRFQRSGSYASACKSFRPESWKSSWSTFMGEIKNSTSYFYEYKNLSQNIKSLYRFCTMF